MLRARLLLLAFALTTFLSGRSWADDFTLVRNVKGTDASVSKSELREMLTGKRKTWKAGGLVQVILAPRGSGALTWLAGVIGISDADLMAKIKQEVFKGELRKPILVTSDAETLTEAAKAEGTLGVVSGAAAAALPAGLATSKVE